MVLLVFLLSSCQSIHVCLLFFCNFSISVPLSSHPGSLYPFPCSSVIMTFKAFLMLLHDGEAIRQWHSTSLCVNLTGNVMGTQRKAFPDETLAMEKKTCITFYFKEMSKLSFKNVVCRMMGRCLYVCLWCVCVRVCVFDWQSKRGTDDGAFINLVRMTRKWNILKYITLTLYDGLLLNWQQWEINIAYFSKIVFSTYNCNYSQSVLMVSVLLWIACDGEMEYGGLKWTCFL